ncbi:I78 family peptidase inhibitor [Brevundimonas subvibrioides]|uniref:Proteinase inhibitor I78 n=1 Tax=Brevundimonas subvibrioides (strain ATCC 15264 / DSM 4735 / LMG 14903 / NBRC 16000 / CB 81) TaxID=633149 RepID=D9QLI9_BRESC|nr:I78 family peptidase inhibitor [Brevundimonas subvibrioides]ADL01883.1 Proteinase inhibitor I78 [Brevundimonas subvibrioides ATCC 15264]
MRMIAGLILAGSVLAGCAATPPASAPEGPKQCDAQAARSLIGSHVGAVDFAAGANVRIVCTTCATTRDYRPDRLNVRFDEATGIIKSVDCG